MAHGFTFNWPDVPQHSHNIHLLKKEVDDLLIKAEKQPTLSLHNAYQTPLRKTICNIIGGWTDDFMILVHDPDDLTHLKLIYGWRNGLQFFIDDALWISMVAIEQARGFSLQTFNGAEDFSNWVSHISDTFTLNPKDDIDLLSEAFYRLGNFYRHHQQHIKDHLDKKALKLQRKLRRELKKQFPKAEETP